MTNDREGGLIRAIGLKDIIALTINGVIGAGIFALPASIAGILGTASPIAFLCAGVFCLAIVLCFAELGGRYDRTGGAYLYASEAFGSGAISFVIGWLYFLARVTSVAALAAGLAGFVSYFQVLKPLHSQLLIIGVLASVGAINIIGIRSGSRVINFLTMAKLIPLLIFIGAGMLLARWDVYENISMPPAKDFTRAILLCMFAFSGYEVIGVPGAEMKNPKRDLPLGMLIGTGITILVYLSIQLVAVAATPNLSATQRPLAEAGAALLGPAGGVLMTVGGIVSTIGTLTGLILVAPRILFAMAVNGQLPPLFARIHPAFRTPALNIVLFTAATTILALLSSFTNLATLSAMARLVTYMGSAIALILLRRKKPGEGTFRIPGGALIPFATVALSLLFLSAATRDQWMYGGGALLVGLLIYWSTRFFPALRQTPQQ